MEKLYPALVRLGYPLQALFEDKVWYRPDSDEAIKLFT